MNQQQTVIGIIKKQKGLIEIIDHLYTLNQNGQFNQKILINLQGQSETGKSKQMSFYLDADEAKQLSYEIRNGIMRNLKYPTFRNEGGLGQLYIVRGNRWGRTLKMDSKEAYLSIAIGNYQGDPNASRNGETVLGQKIDEHKFNLTDFEARILFGKLYDYINNWEMKMLLEDDFNRPQAQPQETPAKTYERQQTQNEQTQEQKPTNPPQTSVNVPVLPSGKNQGKSIEEMNEPYQKWILKNCDGKAAWQEVVDYLKAKGLTA